MPGYTLAVFESRDAAREFIKSKYGYIAGSPRPDLRREPHGWRMPVAVKVVVAVKEVALMTLAAPSRDLQRHIRARPLQGYKAPRPKEIALHMAVADALRRYAKPDWRWSHFPAGEHRDVRTAAKLKAMGVQRGWPDFVLFDPSGRLHALELKRHGEGLNEDQKAFKDWCNAHGAPHWVVRSVDEAMVVLGEFGVLRIKLAAAGQAAE